MPDRIPVELLRGLAVLAEPPEASHAAVTGALGIDAAPTSSEYSDVFLFQMYPYASVHLGPEGMLGGEARERVAGFWRALGLTPPAEPDHLAALLGLYASLAEREALADEPAERVLLTSSRAALLDEHLGPWVFAFLARVRELGVAVYVAWAGLTEDVLRAELTTLRASGEASRVSGHLLDAPELPDPRREGGKTFLDGLLAPVRSGAIVTRADLAGIAQRLDLGLRAGERRYALESLLAQDAVGVLRALAAECERQSVGHRARSDLLGENAALLARRAESSAVLLRELADEAPEIGADVHDAGGDEVAAVARADGPVGEGGGVLAEGVVPSR